MKYSLFLSDFDGTLVREGGKISEKNQAAIQAYREAGGIFAIVTGRMLSSIRPRLLELGLHDTLVAAYQGGMIAEAGTGRTITYNTFSQEETLEILGFFEQEKGLHIQFYADDKLYSNFDDELMTTYERICGVKAIISKIPLSEKVRKEQPSVCKVVALLEPSKRDALYQNACERFQDRFAVTTSSEWMVELLPKRSTKAAAVAFLSEHYGIPTKKIAAIGDQLNDLPMLAAAGGKFAVANAAEELKKIAITVPSVEEDGVAKAIQIAMTDANED